MHRFLGEPDIAAYVSLFGSTVVKAAVDDVLRTARATWRDDRAEAPGFDVLLARVRADLATLEADRLVDVINATGVLLHTNLGRAPVAREALDAAARVSAGYSNLEFDLRSGTRGTRYARVTPLLRELTGAEDALVVNNCAAAMLLALDTFARERDVVVARGEAIEIGGGFRLPDVLERSGATLVDVGTTNKVYLRDYERALRPRTGLLMRTHASNFRIEGFTASVAPRELAQLGRRVGIPALEDLGSGALVDLRPYGLPYERTVPDAIADGFDIVTFSGDKLLGGPQAGIVVGTSAAIARLRANPLLRALRVDKATLAALGETLRLYLVPGARARIPLFAMLGTPLDDLRARAEALAARLGSRARALPTQAYAGGGSAPLAELPSFGVALRAEHGATALAGRMRAREPRVIARIAGGEVILDLRTVPPDRDEALAFVALREATGLV